MTKNMYRNTKKIILAGLLLALFVLLLIFLRNAGSWLVKVDKLKQADALIVLTGSTGDRAQYAADVFHSGQAPKVFIVHNYEPGKEYFADKGIYLPNAAEITRDLLLQLNVPDSSIILLAAQARSTKDEARVMQSYVKQNPGLQSLILLSSASHTRRSMIIFRNRFHRQELQTELISAPSPYTGFNAQRWWTNRESAKDVFNEYTKLFWFLLLERWTD